MNAQDAWLATLGQLQVQLSRATYNTWLSQARYVAYEEGRLVISVPHAYAQDWLEQHLLRSITDTFSSILGQACQVQIIVWDPTDDETDVRSIFGVDDRVEFHTDSDGLFDPTKTLDNFAITDANRDTALFARFVLESKFGEHPSLFISGGPSTGKTHLLHAMANVLLERRLRVVYVNAEGFTSELIAAIRSQNMQSFRDKYRGCDVLIMDEIEFLEGKDSSQQELRHIWDTLSRRRRLMIFASRRLPRDLNISRDLRSCFNRWLLCQMAPLRAESCAAILSAKASQMGLALPDPLRDALVERVGGDPSMIEGALTQLANYARLTRRSLSISMVETLFEGREVPPASRNIDVPQVIVAVAAYFEMAVDDLVGKRRTHEIMQARQLAMYLARVLTEASLPQVGLAFGGRDHTTVLHSCSKISEMLKTDAKLQTDLDNIRRGLHSAALPAPQILSSFDHHRDEADELDEQDGRQLVAIPLQRIPAPSIASTSSEARGNVQR